MRRWVVLPTVGAIAAAIAVTWGLAVKDERVPDEVRIRQVLEDGRHAVMDRDLRGAMACVSRDYRDATGLTYETLKLSAGQAFRNASSYHISMDAPEINHKNGSATASVRIEMVMVVAGISSPVIDFPAEIEFVQEPARRWGIFPVTRWRVTGMSGLPLSRLE